MRVLVLGAGGLLGSDLVPELDGRGHDARGLTRREADLTDPGALKEAMARSRPDAVINCAAFTDVDLAEDRPDEAMRVNRDGAASVALAARTAGARLVHLSTDYVFPGDVPRPLSEDDEAAPLGAYGRSKLAGEQAVQEAMPDALIVRSAWLYGAGGHNFVDAIRARAARGEAMAVVDDQVGSPTWSRALARALALLVEGAASGIVHFAGSGAVSRFDLARAIVAETGHQVTVRPITTAESGRKARRPAYSALSCARYESLAGKAPAWRDALSCYLKES